MQELLEHIDVEPEHTAEASVIFLHGLGADGHDLEPIIKELDLPDDLQIRYIFPHAPKRPITINGGEEMRGWYDFIPHSESEGSEDIKASSNSIYEFIRREMNRGISSQKILLAGFSQGGVIALYAALRFEHRLAGVLALSTYLYDAATTEIEQSDANLAIPIMLAHGQYDAMIPVMRAATARENLIRLGYDVRWFDYPMEHQICLEEVQEMSRFITETLG